MICVLQYQVMIIVIIIVIIKLIKHIIRKKQQNYNNDLEREQIDKKVNMEVPLPQYQPPCLIVEVC